MDGVTCPGICKKGLSADAELMSNHSTYLSGTNINPRLRFTTQRDRSPKKRR